MISANRIPISQLLYPNQELTQKHILWEKLHIYGYVHSCFKVTGARSNLNQIRGKKYTYATTATSSYSTIKDPLWLTVLYDIMCNRVPEPLVGFPLKAITFMAIVFVHLYLILIGLVRLFHHRVIKKTFLNEPLSLTPIKKRRRHRRRTKYK